LCFSYTTHLKYFFFYFFLVRKRKILRGIVSDKYPSLYFFAGTFECLPEYCLGHFRFTTSGDGITGNATSGDVISGDVISGDATSGDVTAPLLLLHKCDLDGASTLLVELRTMLRHLNRRGLNGIT
jgi:hypothetical protein